MLGQPPAERLVEVAIDAAGASGARTYTYGVPARLADLEAGEAVLVEYGRRQALGVVLGEAGRPATGVKVKPVLERVRADGPLLPALSLELARWIAGHYLAPAAFVLRAMLPPGMLERLELVAEIRPESAPPTGGGQADRELLEQLRDGPRAARDIAAPEGRAGLIRRLRSLAAAGAIDLDWTLLGAAGGPRYERWAQATNAGRVAAGQLLAGERVGGRPLGPRQAALILELIEEPAGIAGAELSGRHGTSALAGLVRRGLVAVEVRERPRRPLAHRAGGAPPRPPPPGAPPPPPRLPSRLGRPDRAAGRRGGPDPAGAR
jgi:primosomal protein N'